MGDIGNSFFLGLELRDGDKIETEGAEELIRPASSFRAEEGFEVFNIQSGKYTYSFSWLRTVKSFLFEVSVRTQIPFI